MANLCQLFRIELSRADAGLHVAGPQRANLAPEHKVSPSMHKFLPALVQYSSWLVTAAEVFSTVHGEAPFYAAFSLDVDDLWLHYASVLTKLVGMFRSARLPAVEYLLDEDEETLGYMPFQDMALRYRYVLHDKRRLEPVLAERCLPAQEMLARIDRLVKEGKRIAEMRVSRPHLPCCFPTHSCL